MLDSSGDFLPGRKTLDVDARPGGRSRRHLGALNLILEAGPDSLGDGGGLSQRSVYILDGVAGDDVLGDGRVGCLDGVQVPGDGCGVGFPGGTQFGQGELALALLLA